MWVQAVLRGGIPQWNIPREDNPPHLPALPTNASLQPRISSDVRPDVPRNNFLKYQTPPLYHTINATLSNTETFSKHH